MKLLRELIKKTVLHRPAKRVRDAVRRQLPTTSSSFCWIKEGEGVSTRVYVYNYWSENYGLSRVRLQWALYGPDGRRVGRGVRPLRRDETIVIAAADLAREAGVALPFEGNLVCQLRDRRLRRGLPVQMLGEYLNHDGTPSCVHSQWGFFEPTRPKGAAGGHIHVIADGDYDTVIVPQNCSRSRRASDVRANAPRVTLYNAAGESRSATATAVAPCGFARLSVRDLVPDADIFFAGRSGNARVEMWTPSIRTFHYHRKRDGSISVNHAAGDYASQPERVVPLPYAALERLDRGPLAVAVAWEGDGVSSRYVLHNNYVPVGAHHFDARVYDTAGKLILHRPEHVVLGPRQTRVITLASLLAEASITAPFRGTVQFALSLRPELTVYPPVFQLISEMSASGRIAGADAGSDIFNAPPGRTKVFARVVENSDYETWFCVSNVASNPAQAGPSSTTVSLISGDGMARLTTTVEISAQGAVFARTSDLFPEAAAFLAPGGGLGLVKVRDVTRRLYGYHMLRHRRTGALAMDHLIGG